MTDENLVPDNVNNVNNVNVESKNEGSVGATEADVIDISNESSATESSGDDVQEKMIPQSELNRLIGRAKREAREQEARRIQEEQIASRNVQPTQPPEQALDFSQMTPSQLDAYLDQRAEQKLQRDKVSNFAKSFQSKINEEMDSDPNFYDNLQDLALDRVPKLAFFADEFDNTTEILRELSKDTRKYTEIAQLISIGNDTLAKKQMKKLSDSIRLNNQAKKTGKVPEPLSQMKPSSAQMGGGKQSVSDLRQKYRV